VGNPIAGGLATGPCYYHVGGTTVVAWGANNLGQCGPANFGGTLGTPSLLNSGALSGRTVAAIATGGSHSLALCSDGTLAAWGDNNSGQLGCGNLPAQTNVPTAVLQTDGLSGRTVIAIAAGSSHSLALTSDGQVFGWGSNTSGQLGRSDTSANFETPIHLSQLGALADKQIVAIAAGAHHSLALTADGLLYAWGSDDLGQLGNGFYGSSTTPYPVEQSGALSGKRIVALAAGYTHNLVLDADGNVYTWGSNIDGELGNAGYSSEESPVLVDLSAAAGGRSTTVVALAAGAGFSLALAQDGALYAWGNNSRQQLGLDSYTPTYRTPVAVSQDTLGSDTIVALAASAAHTLARTDSGALYGWGDNDYAQLGGSLGYRVARPALLETGALDGAMIAALPTGCIANHSLVLTNNSADPLALIERWRLDNFNTPFATGSAADDADPDADSRTNLVEYATGTSPINADSGSVATLAVAGTGANRQLTLTFRRIADPTLTYTVEASTTLAAGSWATIVPPALPLTGLVTVTDPTFMSGHTRRFLRLKIVRTP
jgi:alpha-tubulin suppressor-like RCC1 family protein